MFESKPIVEKLLPHIDRTTQLLTNVEALSPRCPRCGFDLMPNVNGGKWYTKSRYEAAAERMQRWLSGALESGKRICVLEFGVGFNTPGVLRWPMEGLAFHNKNVSLVRVNLDAPELPEEIPSERAIPLPMDVLSVVRALHASTFSH